MQIIFGHQDQIVRRKLLLDPKITLDQVTNICRDVETSKAQHYFPETSSSINSMTLVRSLSNIFSMPVLKQIPEINC